MTPVNCLASILLAMVVSAGGTWRVQDWRYGEKLAGIGEAKRLLSPRLAMWPGKKNSAVRLKLIRKQAMRENRTTSGDFRAHHPLSGDRRIRRELPQSVGRLQQREQEQRT